MVVDVGAVQQLQKIIVIQIFVKALSNSLELIKFDDSVFVLVVKTENSLETLLGLSLTNLGADNIEELLEVDGVVGVSQGVDKRQNEGVSLIEAELLQNLVDFCGVNCSASVLVEDLEGVLEILIVLREESVLPGGRSGGLGGLGLLRLGSSAHKICKDNKGLIKFKFGSIQQLLVFLTKTD